MTLFGKKKKEVKVETVYMQPIQRWLPTKIKTKYPKWTFAKVDGTRDYYLLLDKIKMKFISERAFRSWGKNYILVTEESISGYTKWKGIGFAVGSILVSSVDGAQWYISGKDVLAGERQLISNPDFYSYLGFDLRWAFVVSLEEIDFHKKGEDLVVN